MKVSHLGTRRRVHQDGRGVGWAVCLVLRLSGFHVDPARICCSTLCLEHEVQVVNCTG
jgi:hypothetical protein